MSAPGAVDPAADRESVPSGPTSEGLRRALVRIATITAFAVVPTALLAYGFYATLSLSTANSYWDFHPFWNAGHDVLHGRSPYPPPTAHVLAHEKSFVYPAPAALLMVPFALLPFTVAATVFSLLLAAAVPAALFIVGVRDWRCYGIAFLSEPVLLGVTLGTASPLLLLALAAMWRLRDRLWPAACLLAAAIVLKIFFWPLLLWFAFTRRLATAAAAAALIVLTTLAAWAAIGFRGFGDYPDELRVLNHLLQGKGYSLVAAGLSLGAGRTVAEALPWVVGACLLAVVALRGRRAASDRLTFTLAVAAALALSPIVWLHYLLLLYVPIAIASPGLSALWAMPLLLWLVRGQSTQEPIWRNLPPRGDLALTPRVGHAPLIVYAVLVTAAAFSLAAWSLRRPGPRAPTGA